MTPPNEGERLTVAEVAKELRVSQKTVRGLIRREELPAYRISERKTYVLREDLDTFVDSSRTARVTAQGRQRGSYQKTT